MAANYTETYSKIAEHFNTEWAKLTSPPVIAWPNVVFVPPANASWISFHVLDGESVQASIGASTNFYRHVGVVMVNVNSPQNKGMATALGLADSVATIFRSKMIDSNIQFDSPAINFIGVEDGVLRLNVSIPFLRDSLH